MENDSEKFQNTYGKETSYEIFPREASYVAPEQNEPAPKVSLAATIKKYLALSLFIAVIATFIFIGGFVLLVFDGIMLIGMLIRTLFIGGSNSSSSFFILKK